MQLLIRRREGVELTEPGRRVVGACRRMLDEYSRLRHDLDQKADLSVGLVRVGGGATAASSLLPPCIAQLHDAHPGLRFYVREAGSEAVADDIVDGKLDLGVVTSPREVRRSTIPRTRNTASRHPRTSDPRTRYRASIPRRDHQGNLGGHLLTGLGVRSCWHRASGSVMFLHASGRSNSGGAELKWPKTQKSSD